MGTPLSAPFLDNMSEKQLGEWNNDDIFFQFYNYRANDFIELNNENRHAANMFIFLCSRMDKTNAVACSIQFLMKRFNISRTATYSAIKALKDSKFLIVYTTDKVFTFAINSDITWKGTDLGRNKNAYVFNKVKK